MLLLLRSCTKHITRSYVTPPQRYHQGLLIHASDTICFIIIAIIFSLSLSIYVTFFQTWHLLQKFRGDKIRVKRVWWVLSANFTPGWFGIGIRYCPDGDQFIDILPILSAWPWDSRRLVQGGKVPFALSFLCLAVFFSFQPCWIYFYSLTPSSSAVTIERKFANKDMLKSVLSYILIT